MTTTTKERPILFSGPMVRAILDGRKTQTRRLIKPQPVWKEAQGMMSAGWSWELSPRGKFKCQLNAWKENEIGNQMVKYSPFGPPGTMLWVRETWHQGKGPTWGKHCVVYDIDKAFSWSPGSYFDNFNLKEFRKRPSIHMPRWTSRIKLRVKRVWVERVQDISEEDAKAEGMDANGPVLSDRSRHELGPHRYQFMETWASIYGIKSWKENQWVWACEFERVQ